MPRILLLYADTVNKKARKNQKIFVNFIKARRETHSFKQIKDKSHFSTKNGMLIYESLFNAKKVYDGVIYE